MKSWRFFILAGGYGTRARPLSSVRAKPAFPLAGVPLIQRMTEQIVEGNAAIESGWVNLHHLSSTIKAALRPQWPVELILEPTLSGSRVLVQALKDPRWSHLLVVNGDLFCKLPLQLLRSEIKKHDALLLLRSAEPGVEYRPLEVTKGRFIRRLPMGYSGPMFTGVSVLSRRAVMAIKSDNFFDDFERENLDIGSCFHTGLWLDFGDPRSYHHANLQFIEHEGLPKQSLWDPSVRVLGDPESVYRTILWPEVTIQPQTRLWDCVVCDQVVPQIGDWREGVWTPDGFFPF